MKKENVLVIALIAIGFAAVTLFLSGKPRQAPVEAADQRSPDKVALQVTDSVTVAPAETTGIAWKDYTPGMARARGQNKNVFLYFHASWCTYCVKLKKTTFLDEKIQTYLNDNFISISVDTDLNQVLANEWKVRGLPTMWFLTPEGKQIYSFPGYVDSARLLEVLRYVHTKSYEAMSFQEFVQNG